VYIGKNLLLLQPILLVCRTEEYCVSHIDVQQPVNASSDPHIGEGFLIRPFWSTIIYTSGWAQLGNLLWPKELGRFFSLLLLLSSIFLGFFLHIYPNPKPQIHFFSLSSFYEQIV